MEEEKIYSQDYVYDDIPKNGYATPAMVLGIIGFVIGIIPFIGWFAFPLSILAVIFGFLGLNGYTNKGQAISGIILGALMILWKIGFWVFIIVLGILLE